MFKKLKSIMGLTRNNPAPQDAISEGDSCQQPQITYEEAVKRRRARMKRKAQKKARRRNRK